MTENFDGPERSFAIARPDSSQFPAESPAKKPASVSTAGFGSAPFNLNPKNS